MKITRRYSKLSKIYYEFDEADIERALRQMIADDERIVPKESNGRWLFEMSEAGDIDTGTAHYVAMFTWVVDEQVAASDMGSRSGGASHEEG